MSRAFVKEGDESALVEKLPDRPQSEYPNYVTIAGLHALEAHVADLAGRRRMLIGQDSLESRQELSVVERDLRYYEERVKRAILVEPDNQPQDRVHFGARVTVRDEGDNDRVFNIVGEDEADAAHGKISWVSPLAKALLNCAAGDTVTWHRPVGDIDLEIVEIAALGANPSP